MGRVARQNQAQNQAPGLLTLESRTIPGSISPLPALLPAHVPPDC